MNKFIRFIDEVGQANLAKQLGISKQAVNYWRHGIYMPNTNSEDGPSMVQRIIELSEGKLTREDIRPDLYGD